MLADGGERIDDYLTAPTQFSFLNLNNNNNNTTWTNSATH